MNRLARAVAAILLIASALPAFAYTRETTTPGVPQTGVCLWWRPRQVTYRVNATTVRDPKPCQSSATAEATAVAAMNTWAGAKRTGEGAACTDFRFVNGGSTTTTALGRDGTNLIVFRSGVCNETPGFATCVQGGDRGACVAQFNCWDHGPTTIGLTTTSFNAETGEILDADMELNSWNGNATIPAGSYFTCDDPAPRCTNPPYGQAGCSAVDVGAVVTHEAGHMLGLDHVCSTNANDPPLFRACAGGTPVMAPTVGDPALRVLAADDVEGVCKVYPVGQATSTCVSSGTPPSESSGGGGCSTAGGTGIAGLLAAAMALTRRRRTR